MPHCFGLLNMLWVLSLVITVMSPMSVATSPWHGESKQHLQAPNSSCVCKAPKSTLCFLVLQLPAFVRQHQAQLMLSQRALWKQLNTDA